MNMKKQGKNKTDETARQNKQNLNIPKNANQMLESGIHQPHNAKKEGLGPNTDRNA